MQSKELLLEAFDRIPGLVRQVLDGLDPARLQHRPAGNGNSIAWLIWHTGRVEDAQVASAAGLEQVWTAEGFVNRFGLQLGERDTGYGHSSEQVDAVRAPRELLQEYYEAVHRQTVKVLDDVDDPGLDRVVDRHWNPPVTLGVRLVSILGDCLQHVGQAAYAKGLHSGTADTSGA
ncbi:mycothiol transferase [Arthrobacter sp. SAFR-044]|uniref:mycothiol transferase n=1 Tax=Arthrobacter sp. SAFR-044 TaxID=3387278 RepID=UPI003F7B5A59